jgi:hypothetical protein
MYPEMIGQRPPTTSAAIEAFEKERGLKLPMAYESFLLATNGGVPRASLFPVQNRPNDPIDNVQCFLGIDVPIPTSELSYPYDLYVGGFPFGIVPIASQDLGGYVCLDLRASRERVAFWDHRHFWSTGEWRERDLYHVADNFEEFLTLLRSSSS